MLIAGLEKMTLVDYPKKVAATIFTRGCIFKCPFCHNPELVLPNQFLPLIDEQKILNFLKLRQGKLDAVCITGGEPLINPDINRFIKQIKKLGFLVKLDTNGFLTDQLKKIIEKKLVDYIAMDIKGPIDKYSRIANAKGNFEKNIAKSIKLIKESEIDYEFRTTVCHPFHQIDDFHEIGAMIDGAKKYFIQNFVQSKHVDPYTKFTPFTASELTRSKKIIEPFADLVQIR